MRLLVVIVYMAYSSTHAWNFFPSFVIEPTGVWQGKFKKALA